MRFPFPAAPILALMPALLLTFGAPPARALTRVVASVPDLGDMARIIGGKHIRVDVLATGREDIHAVPAKPSFLPRLHRADLLLSLGLEAEHAWLPPLVEDARNKNIRYGSTGWVEVSAGIRPLDVPERFDRSEGEQHRLGNPHFNIGPHCGPIMAQNIARALSAADPGHAEAYEANLQKYLARLEAALRDWKKRGRPLKGLKVVSQHPDVAYLCAFYGMEYVGALEPKPGVQTTPRHLGTLTLRAKQAGVGAVIHNQAQDSRLAERFAADTGARRVQIANMVGATSDIDSWISLQDHNLSRLLEALE